MEGTKGEDFSEYKMLKAILDEIKLILDVPKNNWDDKYKLFKIREAIDEALG